LTTTEPFGPALVQGLRHPTNMGNVQGKCDNPESDSDRVDISWIASGLDVLELVSKELSQNYDKTDKRHGYLTNIETSARLLKRHLDKVNSSNNVRDFSEQIDKLAGFLEKIFSVIGVTEQTSQRRVRDMRGRSFTQPAHRALGIPISRTSDHP
jgi:hypothetical protein